MDFAEHDLDSGESAEGAHATWLSTLESVTRMLLVPNFLATEFAGTSYDFDRFPSTNMAVEWVHRVTVDTPVARTIHIVLDCIECDWMR